MPTTDCMPSLRVDFHPVRPVDVTFDAPSTSSDGGWLLTRVVDGALGTTEDMAAQLRDPRDPRRVEHTTQTLVRQRVFQIVAGYEDASDATTVRHDPLLRVVCGRDPDGVPLASQPTLSRLEARATAREVVRLQRAHERRWVASLPSDLPAVVLDLDGTDDPTHGQQQFAFFNSHYGGTIYAPLLIFDQDGRLVSARMRPGNQHLAQYAAPTLERLIRLIRQRFPTLPILVRADAAFGIASVVNRLDALREELGAVDYLLGVSPNSAVRRAAAAALALATSVAAGRADGQARSYDTATYQSETWRRAHRIVLKAERTKASTDIRCVVTTLGTLPPRETYGLYAGRGDAENRIKDFKRGLMADRLSCHLYLANAFRLQLHAGAYELLYGLREQALTSDVATPTAPPTTPADPARSAQEATGLEHLLSLCLYARAIVGHETTVRAPRPEFRTLRERLLKVAATVRRSARRIWIALPQSFPGAAVFRRLLARLDARQLQLA